MVIGFDGSRAFNANRTGTENYSYQLLLNLSKIDKKNEYFVYLGLGIKKISGWPDNFQFKTIKFPRLWTQLGLAIQTFKDQLDVLFIPAHTLPIIRKPFLKTVVTIHDLGSEYLPSMHQLKQRLYLSFMQKYQLKTSTSIIAVSNATKEDLIKRVGIKAEKISVVYEGFDKELFKPVKNDIVTNTLSHYGLKPQSYFIFVGTVQPRKNLERIVKAFSLFAPHNKQVKFVIAGSKGWLSEEIYQLPKKLGIEGNVKFLGYVPDKNLPALYGGAKALIYSTLFEGFGLPILEAQSCGCPVITSKISSMPEVAGKGAILVDPHNIDDIVRSMRKIEDLNIRNKLINTGLENIKRFSWEKCAKETLKLLEDI